MIANALQELLETNSEDVWTARLFSLSGEYGFDQILYGVVPHKSMPLEAAYLRSNYSARWRHLYDEAKLHNIDPTIAHCMKSTIPIVWGGSLFKRQPQQAFFEEASGYGLQSGITYPIHGPDGEFGVISFVTDLPSESKFRRHLGRTLADLALMRDYVFASSLKFVHKSTASREETHLTLREKECLRWVMQGKSTWEIAAILHCSEATVNFHITNVRDKFRVRTRQQAVVKAIQEGILVPD